MRSLIASCFISVLVLILLPGVSEAQGLAKAPHSGCLELSFSDDGISTYRNVDQGEIFEIFVHLILDDPSSFETVGFKLPMPTELTLLDVKISDLGMKFMPTGEPDEYYIDAGSCIETNGDLFHLMTLRVEATQAVSDLDLKVRPRNRSMVNPNAPAWKDCNENLYAFEKWRDQMITLNPTVPLPDTGQLTLSFDANTDLHYMDVAPGDTFKVYVTLNTAIHAQIKELEVKVVIPDALEVIGRQIIPAGGTPLPTGDLDEWLIAFDPCVQSLGHPLNMIEYTCILTTESDIQTILLDPISDSSLTPAEPSWLDCQDFRFSVDPAWATQAAVVNPTYAECPAPTSDIVALGQFRGSCYYRTRQTMTWEEAHDLATMYGDMVGQNGHLAAVTSQEEHDWLSARVKMVYSADNTGFWLGATDQEREGIWRWTTGEVFSYANWYSGQPDNELKGDEDGLLMGVGSQDQWGDFWLDYQQKGMIEVQVDCPEPDGLLLATDRPNDAGSAIDLSWKQVYVPFNTERIDIYRSDSPCAVALDGLTPIASVDPVFGKQYADLTAENFKAYVYRIDIVSPGNVIYNSYYSESVSAYPNLVINEVDLFANIVELRNPGSITLDYTNYRLRYGNDVEVISGISGPDSLTVHYLSIIDFVPSGGVLQLLPPASSGSDFPLALLLYGTAGPAPSAPVGFTISRIELNLAKAAALGQEMDKAGNNEGDTGGYNAARPTIGESNVVAPTALGSSALINETVFVDTYGNNYIEIFNPLPTLITLDRFAISDGVSFVDSIASPITIQPGQYHVLTQGAPGSFTGVLSSAQLYLYKYTTAGLLELVDQLGWTGSEADGEAPEPGADALVRVPDGNALYLGEFPGANWPDCGGIAALDFVSRGAGRPNNSPSNNIHYVEQYGFGKSDKKGYFETITEAVNAIPAGESWKIIVYEGNYVESVSLPPNTELLGGESDPSTVVLQGTDDQPAVTIPATSTGVLIQGLHFNKGRSASGGALKIEGGDPEIRSVTFKANQATLDGGAVAILDGSPVFTGCQFIRNSSTRNGGAVIVVAGTPTFESCLFYQNSCPSNGAAIYIDDADVLINRCVIDSNETEDYYSGIIHINLGHADVFLTQVTNNPSGPAFYSDGEGGSIDPNCSNDWNNGGDYKKDDLLKSWDNLRYEDPLYCQPFALNFVMDSASVLAIPTQDCPDIMSFGAGACFYLVSEAPVPKPAVTQLYGGAPNPFNPQTVFRFDLAEQGQIDMEVFDIRGHRLLSDSMGTMVAGQHRWTWQGQDAEGRRLSSGVYLIRMKVDGTPVGTSQRVMLIK